MVLGIYKIFEITPFEDHASHRQQQPVGCKGQATIQHQGEGGLLYHQRTDMEIRSQHVRRRALNSKGLAVPGLFYRL